MLELYFLLSSPVHLKDKREFLFPPIVYSGNVYIIRDKKLFEVLSRIGLIQDFISSIRETGNEHIVNWLKKKGLLNEGFLEAVSRYWVNDVDVKKLDDFQTFEKDLNSNPVIQGEYFTTFFKKAILYNLIKNQRDKFNDFIEKELNLIEYELSEITNISSYYARKNNYKNNFFNTILEYFFLDLDKGSVELFYEIDNFNITIESNISPADLTVYGVSGISGIKKSRIKLSNFTHNECLKENTLFKLIISSGNLYRNSFSSISSLKFILERVQEFVLDKISFDKSFLTSLLGDKNCETQDKMGTIKDLHFNLLNYLKSTDAHISKYLMKSEESNIALAQKCVSRCLNLVEKVQSQSLDYEDNNQVQIHSLINQYSYLGSSNLLMASNDEINKLISILNMDKFNLERLNKILFDGDNALEQRVIKFTFKDKNIPVSPLGFGRLNIENVGKYA